LLENVLLEDHVYATRYRVNADELTALVGYGERAWEEVGKWFPSPQCELRLEGVVASGTADVVSVAGGGVLDWKTGWNRVEHPHQLTGYADAFRETYGMPEQGYVLAVEVWLRQRSYRVHKLTEPHLDAWRDSVRQQLASDQWAAGEHCTYCPRLIGCGVYRKYIRSVGHSIAELPTEGVTKYQLGDLYPKSKMLRAALEAYDKLLTAVLSMGPIDLGDGTRLQLKQVNTDRVGAREAWPVLVNEFGFSQDEMAACVKISKSKMIDIAKKHVPKGRGAAEARRVMAALHTAKAITKTATYRKEIVQEDDE
jgi:hypothetical protein